MTCVKKRELYKQPFPTSVTEDLIFPSIHDINKSLKAYFVKGETFDIFLKAIINCFSFSGDYTIRILVIKIIFTLN